MQLEKSRGDYDPIGNPMFQFLKVLIAQTSTRRDIVYPHLAVMAILGPTLKVKCAEQEN